MKKVFELTNKYIILATPLLLFLFLLSIYSFVVMRNGQPAIILFGLTLMFFMVVAFTAGWGKMIKSAVLENSLDEPYLIIKDFAPGVGEYFLSSFGLLVIALLINIGLLFITYYIGMYFIGDVGITADALTKAMTNNEALKTFLSSLTTAQLLKLNMWNMLILSVIASTYFIMMFYPAALFFESKNPIKAFGISLKHTFSKKFFSVLGIYLLIFGVNFFISIFSAIMASNSIMSFVMTLINFYFICYVAIGIFYFYNKNFVNSHLGNSIDTYI